MSFKDYIKEVESANPHVSFEVSRETYFKVRQLYTIKEAITDKKNQLLKSAKKDKDTMDKLEDCNNILDYLEHKLDYEIKKPEKQYEF